MSASVCTYQIFPILLSTKSTALWIKLFRGERKALLLELFWLQNSFWSCFNENSSLSYTWFVCKKFLLEKFGWTKTPKPASHPRILLYISASHFVRDSSGAFMTATNMMAAGQTRGLTLSFRPWHVRKYLENAKVHSTQCPGKYRSLKDEAEEPAHSK